ncbi:MAG: hypothetical protein KF883_01505 [Thermomicrobiales bacterium]|nr:hypothetical protein [Thermomicrobiales bacterium]
MPLGPVELVIFRFPGSEFTSGVATEINALVDSGLVRIIDMRFVMKHADGSALVISLDDMGDTIASFVDTSDLDDEELLCDDDALRLVPCLEPDTSAALILFENVWARKVAIAIREADGVVVLNKRIPRAVIDQMLNDSLV